jgi:hypothetical protein
LKNALLLIRRSLVYRRDVFESGLKAAGYVVRDTLGRPGRGDVLIIWNRYGVNDGIAKRFEAAGAKVVVCENGYLGKLRGEEKWFAMALNHHAGAGDWRVGGSDRWDSFGVQLEPFKEGGREIVVLAQRGIGEEGIASPYCWAETVLRKLGNRLARIRPHPGTGEGIPLLKDLQHASAVITWNSGAALRALIAGIPVWYDYAKWIGAEAAAPLAELFKGGAPKRDEEARLSMFRRMAWAQWRLEEVQSGEAFNWLLAEEV